MRVIAYRRIRDFMKDHPDSAIKLARWFKWMKKGKYRNLNELRNKFPGVDYIGNDRYVFNISGNKYRLVAIINFKAHRAYIRYIGTHAQYNKIDCTNI